mmetsp:Transcript_12098/g.21581  ORF Transcript_12098/g.21581 Transcript_12098/m.21581 type:complete len:263 (-) Transcript_12098:62-850(-)
MGLFAGLSVPQKKKVQQAKAFTCINSNDVVAALLNTYDWDLQRATDAFFSGEWQASAGDFVAEPSVKAVDLQKVEKWFSEYTEADSPELMQVEGIAKFCEALEVNPEDPVMLSISYRFDAENMLEYTKKEFITGMTSIGVDDIQGLKAALPTLRSDLEKPELFKKVYTFTFKWACPPGQRSMPLETAVALWELLLKDKFELLEEWCSFVQANRQHAISKDEWSMLYEFSQVVDKSLSGYDPNAAWPVVIDTFVEHMEEKAKK